MNRLKPPLKIFTVPHPTLTTPSCDVTIFDAKLRKLVRNMKLTLVACVDPIGVGLAAPQVGINRNIFITKPQPESEIKVFINPRILASSEPRKLQLHDNPESEPLEGCLSIPGVWGPVDRCQHVELAWQDEHGKAHKGEFRGFEAVIIQHEFDHLQGILFTARCSQQNANLYEERNGKLYKMKI